MGTKNQRVKSEHNGAKNGGGFWGTRAEAKKASARIRRQSDVREAKHAQEEPGAQAGEATLTPRQLGVMTHTLK